MHAHERYIVESYIKIMKIECYKKGLTLIEICEYFSGGHKTKTRKLKGFCDKEKNSTLTALAWHRMLMD